MKCEARLGSTENAEKWPVECYQCSQWIHGRWSVVFGKMQNVQVSDKRGVSIGSCSRSCGHKGDND